MAKLEFKSIWAASKCVLFSLMQPALLVLLQENSVGSSFCWGDREVGFLSITMLTGKGTNQTTCALPFTPLVLFFYLMPYRTLSPEKERHIAQDNYHYLQTTCLLLYIAPVLKA